MTNPAVGTGTLAPMEPVLVLVRATVHLPDGIHPGSHYWVDASSPYVASAIEGGHLVRVDDTEWKKPDLENGWETGPSAPGDPILNESGEQIGVFLREAPDGEA